MSTEADLDELREQKTAIEQDIAKLRERLSVVEKLRSLGFCGEELKQVAREARANIQRLQTTIEELDESIERLETELESRELT